jgi:hypothetical protein
MSCFPPWKSRSLVAAAAASGLSSDVVFPLRVRQRGCRGVLSAVQNKERRLLTRPAKKICRPSQSTQTGERWCTRCMLQIYASEAIVGATNLILKRNLFLAKMFTCLRP